MIKIEVTSEDLDAIICSLMHCSTCCDTFGNVPAGMPESQLKQLAMRLETIQGREELREGMKNATFENRNPCDKHKSKE
jgi:hypothetical protein